MSGSAMRAMDVVAALWDYLSGCAYTEPSVIDFKVSLKEFYMDRRESVGRLLVDIDSFCGLDNLVGSEFSRIPWEGGPGVINNERIAGAFALRLGLKRIPLVSELPQLATSVAEKSLVDITNFCFIAHRVYVGPFRKGVVSEIGSLLVQLLQIGGHVVENSLVAGEIVKSWKLQRIELLEKDRGVLGEEIVTDLLAIE